VGAASDGTEHFAVLRGVGSANIDGRNTMITTRYHSAMGRPKESQISSLESQIPGWGRPRPRGVSTGVPAAARPGSLLTRFGLGAAALALGATTPLGAAEAPAARPIRVYSHRLEPREHPDYDRRAVKPPDWDTFKQRTQFTALRGFQVENDRIVGYAEELDKFTRTHDLGDVIWPSYPILFAKNLGDLADEIKRRDLYLFDVWGYVPGSGPGGYWQQFKPPAEAFTTLESKLGERWLGTDIGEQDGRYLGGYANQMTPASAGRFEQYLNFQRHFERMGDDLGHKHATLVSLNFGHYFLKEGTYTLIGAETAQALPNSQVYYAFIRGAGKQYGVPWFGNASIFNRWGFKTYGSSGKSDGYEHGPTKGTSLSLLKRLLYSHVLYNCVAVGFENGWLDGEQLSPIGRIQQAAQRWVKAHGQPGVMHTPVALLLDFYSGWSFPRHLYTDKLYRVWGNLPYAPGDYLTDAALDLLYPGYQDASYFHDESGFLTPTPYGDIADALLSDAPLWLLQRYAVVVAAGELAGGVEMRDKLQDYVKAGGHLILTEGNLGKLPQAFGFVPPRRPDQPATELSYGEGRLTVLGGAFGVATEAVEGPTHQTLKSFGAGLDQPLPKPYTLAESVRQTLDRAFRGAALFEAGEGLHLITCRQGIGDYTVGIINNGWTERPFQLTSRCGPIEAVRELPIDQSEFGAVGHTPEGLDASKLGRHSATTIAGGDIRIFAIKVQERNVQEIARIKPPPRPRGRFLPLRRLASLKEEILRRPTFFEHFDGVVVDWSYVHRHQPQALEAESGWLKRQGLRLAVDLSSGVNLYPTLRLINNVARDYEASLGTVQEVLAKMHILGATDLLFTLHRHPENNFSEEQTRAAFDATLKRLTADAAQRGITLHLRLAFGKPPWGLADAARLLERVGAANLKLAPSTGLLWREPTPEETALLKGRMGFLLVAGQARDLTGAIYDAHRRLVRIPDRSPLSPWLAVDPTAPVALDAVFDNGDEEVADVRVIEACAPPR